MAVTRRDGTNPRFVKTSFWAQAETIDATRGDLGIVRDCLGIQLGSLVIDCTHVVSCFGGHMPHFAITRIVLKCGCLTATPFAAFRASFETSFETFRAISCFVVDEALAVLYS